MSATGGTSAGGDPLVVKLRQSGEKGADEAAKLIEERRPFENNPADLASFSLLIDCGFCDDERVRERVVELLEDQATVIPSEFFLSPDIEKLFVQGGKIFRWLEKELSRNNASVLSSWAALVKSSRQPIPIKLLNKLLAILEKCFKNPSQSIRAVTYKCWTVLMDNFALDPNVLCSERRIELITLPLCMSVRALPEDQCALRFDAWWHFMGLFKERLILYFKDVVLPFLQFYFVPSEIKATRTGQSPAKQYKRINHLALEAMAVLFCGLNSVKISQVNIGTIFNCLRNGRGVLSVKTYIDNYKSIFTVLREAISLLGFTKSEVSYMCAIFQEFGTLSMDICLHINEDCKIVLTEFLKLCVETLSSITSNPNGVNMALEILEVVSKMPTDVLTSSKLLETPKKDWLAVTMIRHMLSPNLSNRMASMSDAERNAFYATFERYTSQLQKCRAGGLSEFHASSTCLLQSNLPAENLAVLWKTLASNFERFIERFKEVGHENKDGDLDLSTVELLLSFPFVKFLNSSSRQTWNQWTKLFKQVVDTAETLPAYKSLSIESYLASRMTELCTEKVSVVEHYNLCIHLSESLVASVKSICNGTTSSQDLQIKPPTSVLKLLANLSISMLTLNKNKSATFGTVYKSLCNQNVGILEVSTRPEVILEIYAVMSPAVAALIDNNILSSLKVDQQAAGFALFERVINSIQARYDGPFDDKLLGALKPLLICGLPHPKSKISARCRELWNITFAPNLSNIPSEINDCFKSSSSLLESSNSLLDLTQPTSSPTFRSFFSRIPNLLDSKTLNKSPNSSNAKIQSPVQSQKAKRPTISIEDENSSNFVVISPSSRKRRPLTEHQKEKLLSRNDSVPALYSELSRDEMEVGKLLPIFDSQQSMDGSFITPESSQQSDNAVDSITTKLKENKEVNSTDKRKQPAPHRFVAPPRTRTRKRTFDEANKDSQIVDQTLKQQSAKETVLEQTRSKSPDKEELKKASPRKSTEQKSSSTFSPRKSPFKEQSDSTSPKKSQNQEKAKSPSPKKSPTQEKAKSPSPKKSPRQEKAKSPSPKKSPAKDESKSLIVRDSQEAVSGSEVSLNHKSGSPSDVIDKGLPGNIVDSMEPPLILESVENSRPFVAKKLAFESQHDVSGVSLDEPSTESSKEEDFIESSQLAEPRPSKRLRLDRSRAEEPSELDAKSPTLAQSGRQKRAKVNHFGETKLHISVRRDKVDDVKMHLENGVPVNQGDNFGWTPLHEAFVPQQHSFTILRLLVENGADVNAQASDGSTPLHAALNQRASQDIIDYLLVNGADPNIKNNAGVSPADRDPQLLEKLKPTVLKTGDAEASETEGGSIDSVCSEPSEEKDKKEPDDDVTMMPSPAPPKTVRTPLPFSKGQPIPSGSPLSHISRGEKMISLSKTKSFESSLPSMSVTDLMSPKPVLEATVESEPMTPKQDKPWLRYEPSPMDKMPSVSILKDATSNAEKPEEKKGRRVQFTNPIVSDEVWFEKPGSGTSTRQRQSVRPGLIHRTQLNFENNSSIGSYEMSQDFSTPNYIYPSLIECDEDIASVMHNLADARWYKLLSESLKKNNIHKISDLSKLTRTKALALQGIKPPGNVQSIKNALRIFEKSWKRKVNTKKTAIHSSSSFLEEAKKTGLASILDETSPEEEEKTLEYIYNRPSPPRPDDLSPIMDSQIENFIKSASPQKRNDTPSPDLIIENAKVTEVVINEVLEVAVEKLDNEHSYGTSQGERPDENLESSENRGDLKDKKVTKKVQKRSRKASKRGRLVAPKNIANKRKGTQEEPVTIIAETPIGLLSKELSQLECANEGQAHESIESGELISQEMIQTDPDPQISSSPREDTFLQATEHIEMINNTLEDISKLVPTLRPGDQKTLQYLRLNVSNHIQKAAAILVQLSTSDI